MVLSISHGILWVCACVCVCALSFEHHTLSADHMKHDKILVSNVIISRMCVPLNIRDVQFHMGLPSSWDTKPSKSDFFPVHNTKREVYWSVIGAADVTAYF